MNYLEEVVQFIKKDHAIHAYLCCNIANILKLIMSIALLITEISEKGASAVDFTHSINKEMLCPWSNDINHISEVSLNSLDRQKMQTPFNRVF
jgi:hypothetical protein